MDHPTGCLHGTKSSWTPTLAEVSYKFAFVRLSIYLECKISGLSFFFLIFFHEVRHPKVRKVTDPSFLIEVQMGSKDTKSPCKMMFLGF